MTGPELEKITRQKEVVADARKYTPVPVPVSLPFDVPTAKKQDKFAEVMKYKELLDEGIITEEEFERKKKELLDL